MDQRKFFDRAEYLIEGATGLDIDISGADELTIDFIGEDIDEETGKLVSSLVLAILDHEGLLDEFQYVETIGTTESGTIYETGTLLDDLSPRN